MENDTPVVLKEFSLISKNVLCDVVGQVEITLLLVHQMGPFATPPAP
jgi:hypothetical protein